MEEPEPAEREIAEILEFYRRQREGADAPGGVRGGRPAGRTDRVAGRLIGGSDSRGGRWPAAPAPAAV
jgi:hypothetical protein